jgi:homocysteine S-methyltransferase
MSSTSPRLTWFARSIKEYAKVGAEILETNTFGATRQRLGAFGFAEKLKAINLAGVRLAREAANGAFVAGAVGPLRSV